MRLDDHKTVRRNLLAWLRELTQIAADHKNCHLNVAHSVVMCGGIVPEPAGEGTLPEYEAWHERHRDSFNAAVIRLLKRHRRWAAVKRILTINWDDTYGGHIITPEFHASYLAWLESSR